MERKSLRAFSDALEDHSAEGIAILTSEPSRLIQALILVIVGFVLAAIIWAFIGRSDVIVIANGVLEPEGEVRRIYAPIGGEMVDIFAREGYPVSKGDVLARINARGAVEAATRALDAEIKLTDVKREQTRYPAWKALKLREVDSIKRRIEIEQKAHEVRVAEGLEKFSQAQKSRLEEARSKLATVGRDLNNAKKEWDRYRRLFKSPGGGGVAKGTVDEKRDAYLKIKSQYEISEAKLSELDFALSTELAQARTELESSDQELIGLQLSHDALVDEIDQEENRLKFKLRTAQLAAQTASRINFENIDEDNFLQIIAPVSGVITRLAFDQPGDKVESSTPIGAIAPSGAKAVLKVDIKERDRGFLQQGQPVKMKFNAFPYQRYGIIEGRLEFISPATELSPITKEPAYKAHVSLEKSAINVDDREYLLRYGMIATAEIVVRKRRLIDLALDPFRNL